MKKSPPLASVLAQQPSLNYIAPIITATDQLQVLRSLEGVPDAYRYLVLKKLVHHLENTNQQLEDAVVDAYAQYMLGIPAAQPVSQVSYHLGPLGTLVLEESRATLLQLGSTSHRTWEAGKALADYFVHNQDTEPSGTIVELGSGCGLVGFVLARLGASVKVTDGDPMAVERLEQAARANSVNCQCEVVEWGAPPPSVTRGADLVVAADVLYDPAFFEDFLECTAKISRTAVVSTTVRNPETYADFKAKAEAKGWHPHILSRVEPNSAESDYFWLVPGPPIEVLRLERRRINQESVPDHCSTHGPPA